MAAVCVARGALARYGRESFRLISAAPDYDWIVRAAAQFDVTVRDVSEDEGGVALIGTLRARRCSTPQGWMPRLSPSRSASCSGAASM